MTDLMTYLQKAYDEAASKLEVYKPDHSSESVQHFVDFCKKQLKGNPPTSVFMAVGLGLRLADGTEVNVVEQPPDSEAIPDSIAVTKPKSMPGQFGITDTRAVPVFGGK